MTPIVMSTALTHASTFSCYLLLTLLPPCEQAHFSQYSTSIGRAFFTCPLSVTHTLFLVSLFIDVDEIHHSRHLLLLSLDYHTHSLVHTHIYIYIYTHTIKLAYMFLYIRTCQQVHHNHNVNTSAHKTISTVE